MLDVNVYNVSIVEEKIQKISKDFKRFQKISRSITHNINSCNRSLSISNVTTMNVNTFGSSLNDIYMLHEHVTLFK